MAANGSVLGGNGPASLSSVPAAEHTGPLACSTRFIRPERRLVTLRHMQEEGIENVEKHGSCGLGQLEQRPETKHKRRCGRGPHSADSTWE